MRLVYRNQSIAVLLVVACLASKHLSDAHERDLADDRGPLRRRLHDESMDYDPDRAPDAKRVMELVRSYETCNVKSLLEDADGNLFVVFTPECERNRGRSTLQQVSNNRAYSLMASRGIIEDTLDCVSAFLKNIVDGNLSVPRACCRAVFPIGFIFRPFCE